MMFSLVGCNYAVSKSNNTFFFKDRDYKWASGNSVHVETMNIILLLFILNKRKSLDPSRSRPRSFL